MSYRLNARPEVPTDILQAADWYENEEAGLGAEFVEALRKTIGSPRVNPLLYRIRHAKWRVRWVLHQRFPYRVIFVVENQQMTVLAVIHAKRHDRHGRESAKSR